MIFSERLPGFIPLFAIYFIGFSGRVLILCGLIRHGRSGLSLIATNSRNGAENYYRVLIPASRSV